MASRIRDLFDRWHLSKVQDRWSAAREAITELEPFQIHALRAEARALRRRVDRVIHVADHRLAVPFPGAGLPRAPLGTDWAWRPDAWCGPLSAPGIVAADPRNPISGDLALYHDCPLGEVSVRQIRNRAEADRAPFGLAIEVFGFRGSFLSLAVTLPEAAIQGLRSRHLIRLDAVLEAERPQRAFARLNVKHGPNVAQLVQEFPAEGREKLAEFDLAYARINETRIERAWLDIIFNDPAQTRIILRDVVLGRRPRAEA